MQHLTILTGASRGLGFGLAEQLCRPGAELLCISRTSSPALAAVAERQGARLTQWSADLAEPAAVAMRLRDWLAARDASRITHADLINNAGMVGRLGPMDPLDAGGVGTTMRVNLEAPMLLTAAFLEATRDWTAPRRILNISSGLARLAMAGTAMYCAAKAGLDHFSRSVALDEARHAHGARIVSLAPGVVDTDMQADLRAGDAGAFPERNRFVSLKETAGLTSPAAAAARVLAYLARPDFGSQVVADVRDA